MTHLFNMIIFHRGCVDGFSGFLIALRSERFGDDYKVYQDVPSTNNIPPNVDGTDILIIDVAYKKEVLGNIFRRARSVVFIDHHQSIHQDVMDLYKLWNRKIDKTDMDKITIVYDEMRSGCTLTWKYFYPNQKIPLFLKFIEDQDTGRWEYPRTKPFIFALKAYNRLSIDDDSIKQWNELFEKKNVYKLIKLGIPIQYYNNHLIDLNLSKHSRELFPSKEVFRLNRKIFTHPGQYTVAVFNGMGCPSITELAIVALERLDCDFCIMWALNLDKKEYIMSMRSNSVDVSEICQLFGGGGHRLAAACSFPVSRFSIIDMFEGKSIPRAFK
jgi:oligoribonuclease NrnB/cAMP/cGMP phosphodiesterase (DHH superfamily)